MSAEAEHRYAGDEHRSNETAAVDLTQVLDRFEHAVEAHLGQSIASLAADGGMGADQRKGVDLGSVDRFEEELCRVGAAERLVGAECDEPSPRGKVVRANREEVERGHL